MQRGLVHALAWTLATGAAVTLSWWGVRTVMSGTAYDRPKAIPLTAGPLSSSTHGAKPEPSRLPSGPSAPSSASPSPAAPSPSAPSGTPGKPRKSVPPSLPGPGPTSAGPSGGKPSASGGGRVEGRTVDGGRVVFELGTSSAELVSATPSPGWQMQLWKQPTWIRVTFTKDGRESSVFCTWHDHPPTVETWQT
ncbi:hypothetical protein [Streptomyces sp. NPDC089799]|uniref:hypothetical protein n=1 Tax=Streptomyces sp. NPDC089799 TaxID=3155066 RepID=UPI0034181060